VRWNALIRTECTAMRLVGHALAFPLPPTQRVCHVMHSAVPSPSLFPHLACAPPPPLRQWRRRLSCLPQGDVPTTDWWDISGVFHAGCAWNVFAENWLPCILRTSFPRPPGMPAACATWLRPIIRPARPDILPHQPPAPLKSTTRPWCLVRTRGFHRFHLPVATVL
jgi:hypothetical protein